MRNSIALYRFGAVSLRTGMNQPHVVANSFGIRVTSWAHMDVEAFCR